jgi:hypothetical protein
MEKRYPLKLFQEWGRRVKANGRGHEFKYDTFDTL